VPENENITHDISSGTVDASIASDVAMGEPVGTEDVPYVPECA
jgi:hypothetical protein